MNKDDWVWVGIRLFGVYLLVLAVISIPDVIAAISNYKIFSDVDITANSGDQEVAVKMLEMWKTRGIKAISEVVIYSVIGLYFIRGGRLLHRIVVRGNDA